MGMVVHHEELVARGQTKNLAKQVKPVRVYILQDGTRLPLMLPVVYYLPTSWGLGGLMLLGGDKVFVLCPFGHGGSKERVCHKVLTIFVTSSCRDKAIPTGATWPSTPKKVSIGSFSTSAWKCRSEAPLFKKSWWALTSSCGTMGGSPTMASCGIEEYAYTDGTSPSNGGAGYWSSMFSTGLVVVQVSPAPEAAW